MELVIERDAFMKSLSKLQGIVERRTAMPILSNSLFRASQGTLELVATDLEVTVIDKCPVDLQGEGTLTLNAKKLHDIVRELPKGPVYFKCDDECHVEVKADKMRFELAGISSDEYPKIPEIKGFNFFMMPAALLLDMIAKTIYAAGGEEGRYNLNGIFTEKTEKGLRMVATDGHRLAKIEKEISQATAMEVKEGVILPRKGMAEAMKLLAEEGGEVGFAIQEKMAALRMGETLIIMRLVDGKYPDYRRVIVEGCDKTARIKKEELIKHLRPVSTMVDDKARAVKFSFSQNILKLESKNPNFGSSYSEIEVEYTGEKIAMSFNDRYLMDIINAGKGETIVLEMKDEKSPALITISGEPEYICVVMPMRM